MPLIGYAVCDEENIENVFAVGAPTWNAQGETIAAISDAAPRQKRSAKAIDYLCRLLKESAAGILQRLGALPLRKKAV